MDYRKRGEAYSRYRDKSITEWVLGHLEVVKLFGSLKNRTVLDYGCGDGIFSRFTRGKGAVVIGVDNSEEMIRIAKQNDSAGIDYHTIDSGDLYFIDRHSIDCVACNFVLCAIPSQKEIVAVLQEISRVLKLAGSLVILNPNWEDFNGKEGVSFRLERHEQVPGQKTYSILKSTEDLRVDNYYWPIEEYEEMLSIAGFKIDEVLRPKATGDEYEWLDERDHSPTILISATKKAGRPMRIIR